MAKRKKSAFEGIFALPAFPVIFLTVDHNVMPAASFHYYSVRPPCVMVGTRQDNYTYKLLLEKGEFAANLVPKEMIDIARYCGTVSGAKEDKFAAQPSLTPVPATAIDGVIIEECPVNIECKVVHQIQYEGSHHWFIGKIVAVHIDDNYTRDMCLMYWMTEFRSLGEFLGKHEEK